MNMSRRKNRDGDDDYYEDDRHVLSFRKWVQHLVMVLGGILVGFAYAFPFLLLLACIVVIGQWLGWL